MQDDRAHATDSLLYRDVFGSSAAREMRGGEIARHWFTRSSSRTITPFRRIASRAAGST